MLTHELNNFTMSEAVKFYGQLKAAFKYLVPMGVATNISQPYVETNYSLPNFEQCRFSFLSCDDVTNTRSQTLPVPPHSRVGSPRLLRAHLAKRAPVARRRRAPAGRDPTLVL